MLMEFNGVNQESDLSKLEETKCLSITKRRPYFQCERKNDGPGA